MSPSGAGSAAAARSASASAGSPSTPVSTGFITATRRPRWRNAVASAHATNVLPTPVSVPVMKRALTLPWPREGASSARDFLDRLARDVDEPLQLRRRDRERRHEHDHVAERAEDHPPRARHALADARRWRVGDAPRALRHQLDADHASLLPHVPHVFKRRDVGGQPLAEACDLGGQTLERALLVEEPQAREGDRAAKRVAGVSVAMEEGTELLVGAEEGREHLLGRERRGER